MNKTKFSFLLFFLVTVIVFAQQKKYITYTVKKGETIKNIAKDYDLSTRDLLRLNPDVDRRPSAGVVIIVPNKNFGKNQEVISAVVPKETSTAIFYEVLQKDTLYGISKKFGVSIDEINKANPLLVSGLKAGMHLTIPKLNKVETTTTNNFIYHTVVKDNTIYNLTKKYAVTETELLKLNPSLKEGLKLGMVLKIKPIAETNVINPAVNVIDEVLEGEEEVGKFTEHLNLEKRINVVFLLPYQLNKMDEPADFITNIATDFHMGSEIAIDSLRKKGVKLNVQYFDCENSINKLESIIRKTDFKAVDVVIGPLFFDKASWLSTRIDSEIIVPFYSKKQGSISKENLIKSSAKDALLESKLLMHLKEGYEGENIIVINDGKPESQSELWRVVNKLKAFEGVPTISVIKPEKGYIASGRIAAKLNENIKNWVILLSDENVTTASTINNLKGYADKMDITLIALNKSKNFDNVDSNTLGELNFLYPTSEFLDMGNAQVKNFFNEYKNLNNALPSSYAVRGFDVTYDTLARLSSNTTLDEGLKAGKSSRIASTFNYIKPTLGSFENNGIYLIQYTKSLVPIVFH